MTYYTKTNTADPRTGFISVGEILTEAQADALGEDKLNELVERGVLGVSGGTEKPESKQTTPPDNPEEDDPEDDPEEADEGEDSGDDLPTLDAGDVIADEVPAKSAIKRGGRKAK